MHTSIVKILGAKAVDFKQLFCQIPMDLSQGNAIGNGCETFNWQDSANIALLRKFKQSDFPLEAKITFDMVTSGKGVKYVVCDVELPQPTKVP